jgi:hypothetical protein
VSNSIDDANQWVPWAAIPSDSGFRVGSSTGHVLMAQVDATNFVVSTPFRFENEEQLGELRAKLQRKGRTAVEAAEMVDRASTYPAGSSTDLASVPPFLAWFEAPYGRHTLAALIHDQLIVDTPNGGALGSDTLSDRFFRNMMGAAGVPAFKRWLMWTAVAARTRWAAKGQRRIRLIAWAVLAVIGIGCAGAAIGTWVFGWPSIFDWTPRTLLGISLVLPFAAGFLWGRQYVASIVAAAAGLWLIPAGVIVLFAIGVYLIVEKLIVSTAVRVWDSLKKNR